MISESRLSPALQVALHSRNLEIRKIKVKKLILTEAKNSNVDNQENMDLIKKMTLNGLNYDFFAESMGEIDEAFSERDFDFDIDDGQVSYKTKGFINKLFIKPIILNRF